MPGQGKAQVGKGGKSVQHGIRTFLARVGRSVTFPTLPSPTQTALIDCMICWGLCCCRIEGGGTDRQRDNTRLSTTGCVHERPTGRERARL